MTNLKNALDRVRKITEHVDEMEDIIEGLKGEREALTGEILEYLKTHKDAFNVATYKNRSVGYVGRNCFAVNYGLQLARKKDLPTDDQKWLAGLAANTPVSRFIKPRFAFDKAGARTAALSGTLGEEDLKEVGLCLNPTASLIVRYVPDDVTIAALKDEAEHMLDTMS